MSGPGSVRMIASNPHMNEDKNINIFDKLDSDSSELKNIDFIKQHANHFGEILCFVPEKISDNYQIMARAVEEDGNIIEYASTRLRNYKRLCLKAIKTSEHSYFFFSRRLQKDEAFCFELITLNPFVFDFIPKEFQTKKKFLFRATRKLPCLLLEASKNIKNCPNTMKRLIALNSDCSKYLGKNLKKNQKFSKEISKNSNLVKGKKRAYLLIKKQKLSLRNCSNILRNDKKIVLQVMRYRKFDIKYASKNLLRNKSFIKEACNIYLDSFAYASKNLKKNKELVLQLMESNPEILQYADTCLKRNKSLALMMVKADGMLIKTLPYKTKYDINIAIESIKNNPFALKFLPDLAKNEKILNIAAKQNPYSIMYHGYEYELVPKRNIILENIIISSLKKLKKHIDIKNFYSWAKLNVAEYDIDNWYVKKEIYNTNFRDQVLKGFFRQRISQVQNSYRLAAKALSIDPVAWHDFFLTLIKNDPILCSIRSNTLKRLNYYNNSKHEIESEYTIEYDQEYSIHENTDSDLISGIFYKKGVLGKKFVGVEFFSKTINLYAEQENKLGKSLSDEEYKYFKSGRPISNKLKSKIDSILFSSNKDGLEWLKSYSDEEIRGPI